MFSRRGELISWLLISRRCAERQERTGRSRVGPSGARLKVKPLDHVAGGQSGVGRRYSLRLVGGLVAAARWKRAARLAVAAAVAAATTTAAVVARPRRAVW